MPTDRLLKRLKKEARYNAEAPRECSRCGGLYDRLTDWVFACTKCKRLICRPRKKG